MPNREFYWRNRHAFGESMQDGATAVFFSGSETPVGIDGKYPFIGDKNFRYLTGLAQPELALVAIKRGGETSFTLYIEKTDDYRMRYEGPRLNKADAAGVSGLEEGDIVETQELADLYTGMGRLLRSGAADTLYLDFLRRDFVRPETASETFANDIRRKFPFVRICNSYPLVARQRLVKTPEEIDCIRSAIGITGNALDFMLQTCRSGMYEYEWRAAFEYVVARSGCRTGFDSIVAQGRNATYLHYARADEVVEDSALVLLDVGAEVQGYSADISRTYPANGRFTPRQRELYDFVRGAVRIVHEQMVCGNTYRTHVEALQTYYRENLPQLGVAKTEKEMTPYLAQLAYGCCHHLGLDTHDGYFMGPEKLEPGMVFTNEPGIYLAGEGIGIRLEEDLLITDAGNELLSSGIAIEADDVEAACQKEAQQS